MEVPDFLGNTFKVLERHGHALRARHGPELKRHVKYDDEEMSLFVNVRLPGQEPWIKVTPDFVRTLRKETTARNCEHYRDHLTVGAHQSNGMKATGSNRIALSKENKLPQSSTLLKYGGSSRNGSWGSQRTPRM